VHYREKQQNASQAERIEVVWTNATGFQVTPRRWAGSNMLGLTDLQQFLGIGYGTFLIGAPAAETSPGAIQ
jgi:hypothetical protein